MEQQVCHPTHECRKRRLEAFFVVSAQVIQVFESQNDMANLDDTWLILRASVHEGGE